MLKSIIALILVFIVLMQYEKAFSLTCEICGNETHSSENCPELRYDLNQKPSHEDNHESLSSTLGAFGTFSSGAVIVASGEVQYDIRSLLPPTKHTALISTLSQDAMWWLDSSKNNDKRQWEYFQSISKSLKSGSPTWRKLWEAACLYALDRLNKNYRNYVNLAQSLVFLGYYDSALDVLAQAEFIAWFNDDQGFINAIERWKLRASEQRKY